MGVQRTRQATDGHHRRSDQHSADSNLHGEQNVPSSDAPRFGCQAGQDYQPRYINFNISGFGIAGTVQAQQTPAAQAICVPEGSSTLRPEDCAQLRALIPTTGCEVTYTKDDSLPDNSQGAGSFLKSTAMNLLCRGNRTLLMNNAQRMLEIGYGINH